MGWVSCCMSREHEWAAYHMMRDSVSKGRAWARMHHAWACMGGLSCCVSWGACMGGGSRCMGGAGSLSCCVSGGRLIVLCEWGACMGAYRAAWVGWAGMLACIRAHPAACNAGTSSCSICPHIKYSRRTGAAAHYALTLPPTLIACFPPSSPSSLRAAPCC